VRRGPLRAAFRRETRLAPPVSCSANMMSKTFVNHLGHVGYLHQGRTYFVGLAPEGADGFALDE